MGSSYDKKEMESLMEKLRKQHERIKLNIVISQNKYYLYKIVKNG